jgi:hypothetical protein
MDEAMKTIGKKIALSFVVLLCGGIGWAAYDDANHPIDLGHACSHGHTHYCVVRTPARVLSVGSASFRAQADDGVHKLTIEGGPLPRVDDRVMLEHWETDFVSFANLRTERRVHTTEWQVNGDTWFNGVLGGIFVLGGLAALLALLGGLNPIARLRRTA